MAEPLARKPHVRSFISRCAWRFEVEISDRPNLTPRCKRFDTEAKSRKMGTEKSLRALA